MNRARLLGLLVAIAAGAQSRPWPDVYAEESAAATNSCGAAAYLALFSKMGLQPGAPTSASKLFATLPQNDLIAEDIAYDAARSASSSAACADGRSSHYRRTANSPTSWPIPNGRSWRSPSTSRAASCGPRLPPCPEAWTTRRPTTANRRS